MTNHITVAIINEVDIYMMKIDIKEADKKLGLAVPFQFLAKAEDIGATHDDYSFEGDIEVKGELVATGRGYRVSGQISCTKSFVCDRCLEQASQQQTGGRGRSRREPKCRAAVPGVRGTKKGVH